MAEPTKMYLGPYGLMLNKELVDDALGDETKLPRLIVHALGQSRPSLRDKLEHEDDPRNVAYLQGGLSVIRAMANLDKSLREMKANNLLDIGSDIK